MGRRTAVVILLMLAFLVAFHQYYYWRTWFEVGDIHHETFVVALICLALGIVLSKKLEGAYPNRVADNQTHLKTKDAARAHIYNSTLSYSHTSSNEKKSPF